MPIKVSTLLAHNTELVLDVSPTLGGILNTGGYSIENGINPVTISGNDYPVTQGTNGQVLTTDGTGGLFWQAGVSGSITLTGDVTGTGNSPVTTTIANTSVIANSYGSSSQVSTFTVNSQGRLTAAGNSAISITPSAAGLGNVTNALQVINAGGTPSITEGTGIPVGSDTLGAIYIDRATTDGNGIYYYNGSGWTVVAVKPNLYSEKVNGFTTPVASALDSVAIGSGAETESSATNSLAIGMQSLARIPGGVVQASGRFTNNGDAQAGRYLLRGTTINPSPQELFVDGTGGSKRLLLSDGSTWSYKIMVTGHRTDTDNGHAGYTASGVIYRNSGANTTSFQGTPNKQVLGESNPAWDINISADTINGSLKITVTGESGKIIRWVALVETVEITN